MKNYFLAKLYGFAASSSQDLLSAALIFSEDKERLFSYYSKRVSLTGVDAAQIFAKYAMDELQTQQHLLFIYKECFGKELSRNSLNPLQDLFFRKCFKFKRNSVFFEHELDKLIWLDKKSVEFYQIALKQTIDVDLRNFFKQLVLQAQQRRADLQALLLEAKQKEPHSYEKEQRHKEKLLTLIQPGLAGLMDGSVSTLAPIFAAAFATGNTKETFLVGLSASIGAGISMGFTEAIHDDGKVSGRGSPLKRGLANGVMTTIGGLGHTLPYLINNFKLATTIAIIVVFIELWAIVWIQNKFMKISFWRAATQVLLGGVLVFATGIIIGKS